jgi:hypothetical protein
MKQKRTYLIQAGDKTNGMMGVKQISTVMRELKSRASPAWCSVVLREIYDRIIERLELDPMTPYPIIEELIMKMRDDELLGNDFWDSTSKSDL